MAELLKRLIVESENVNLCLRKRKTLVGIAFVTNICTYKH